MERMSYHVHFHRCLGNRKGEGILGLRIQPLWVPLVEYSRKSGGDIYENLLFSMDPIL